MPDRKDKMYNDRSRKGAHGGDGRHRKSAANGCNARGRTRTPSNARPAPRHAGPSVGMLEWFRIGEHDRVDRVLDDMQSLGVTELRTGISWADCWTPEGETWYAWLLPQLARRVKVTPCFVDTPPGWGVAPKTSAPPGNLKSYADFLDVLITRRPYVESLPGIPTIRPSKPSPAASP